MDITQTADRIFAELGQTRRDRAVVRASQLAFRGHHDDASLISAMMLAIGYEDRLDANHMARAEIRTEQNAKVQREVEDDRKLDRARTLQPHAWAA